jgi:hypothetical protein
LNENAAISLAGNGWFVLGGMALVTVKFLGYADGPVNAEFAQKNGMSWQLKRY